ncbi:Piso0_002989 [Millerozyma farinosa CBS 7064]|uniref:Piso0_002989 protein n=1 Tax=Pichia sorbitophila (strain ATCC MYA-4447 / BCRC 22081 / CBS 7064 / NBRC 10061 / NRRL Y-12695) TaxID=559304 RepID=G8YGW0_PICSO|nr:Piso0_002989 [Millerozyma farinosa CBS 7064]CCE80662.1 Piso0_002989 [Millerozyma farinosa CBS 7064]
MADYSSQTVAQLKEVLKSKGLSTEGKKADLVQRLIDNDNEPQAQPETEQPEKVETNNNEEKPASSENGKTEENESTLKVIMPEEKKEEQSEEKKPKDLSPEERKKLAVELLQKKIHRAEKFGDEAGAETARKDLARVEKFGVEAGTALAREIGLVNKSLPNPSKITKHKKGSKGHKPFFKPKPGKKFKRKF